MNVLRHGAMGRLFGGVRAPSTLGTFLRWFTWGTPGSWRRCTGTSWPGLPRQHRCCRARMWWRLSILTLSKKRVFGYRKHGAAFGYAKIGGKSLLVRGLNVLAATISTPLAAPVTAPARTTVHLPVLASDLVQRPRCAALARDAPD